MIRENDEELQNILKRVFFSVAGGGLPLSSKPFLIFLTNNYSSPSTTTRSATLSSDTPELRVDDKIFYTSGGTATANGSFIIGGLDNLPEHKVYDKYDPLRVWRISFPSYETSYLDQKRFPNLTTLDLTGNTFTEFDTSINPKLVALTLSGYDGTILDCRPIQANNPNVTIIGQKMTHFYGDVDQLTLTNGGHSSSSGSTIDLTECSFVHVNLGANGYSYILWPTNKLRTTYISVANHHLKTPFDLSGFTNLKTFISNHGGGTWGRPASFSFPDSGVIENIQLSGNKTGAVYITANNTLATFSVPSNCLSATARAYYNYPDYDVKTELIKASKLKSINLSRNGYRLQELKDLLQFFIDNNAFYTNTDRVLTITGKAYDNIYSVDANGYFVNDYISTVAALDLVNQLTVLGWSVVFNKMGAHAVYYSATKLKISIQGENISDLIGANIRIESWINGINNTSWKPVGLYPITQNLGNNEYVIEMGEALPSTVQTTVTHGRVDIWHV